MKKINFDAALKKHFKNKTILITGHTGFVGSWVTYYFTKLGAKVTGISSSRIEKNNLFELLKIKNYINHYSFDLCKKKNFFKISQKKFDVVLHLAAKPLVLAGINEPDNYIKNNILSTLNIFNQIKKGRLFINFTTDKVYKNKDKKNYSYKEIDELGGEDPYSYSKTCSDMLTKVWSKIDLNKNKKFCNIRSGNIIGGGDWNQKRIISDIVGLIFSNKKLLIRNKNSTRPWVHIIEVCICLSKLILKLEKHKSKYSEWNIGPNKNDEKNIHWIIKESLKLTNNQKLYKKVFFLKKKQFKEKNYLRLNNNKLKKEINFNFKLKFYQRLKMTLEWYSSFFKDKANLKNIIIKQINYVLKYSK